MINEALIKECKDIWCEFVGRDIFEDSKNLYELGLDSIRVVELGLALGNKLGRTVSWADLNVSTSFAQFVANVCSPDQIH